MSPLTIAFVGALIVVLSVAPGVLLWWPSRRDAAARSDLGVALMTGALIAFSVLAIQVLIDRDVRRRDEVRQKADEQRNFELTLSLQRDLTGIKLDGENLRGFYLYNKILVDAELNETDMREATLIRSNLTNARIRDANLTEATLSNAVLTQAKLERSDLTLAIVTEANMFGAVLSGATLRSADFFGAVLEDVDFSGADLAGATFAGANLKGADMSEANVDHATDFSQAMYDANTKFPPGVRQAPCRRDACEAV